MTLRHIRIRSVRLYSMKGGVRVYITSRWEVWDYSQWMVLWELTSHKNWKCETILNEGWCVALHHIRIRSVRLYSLKSGVWLEWEVWDYTQWGVVRDFASHKNWKCETILNEGWCVTLHHIRIRSVRLYSCDFTSHHKWKCCVRGDSMRLLTFWWQIAM